MRGCSQDCFTVAMPDIKKGCAWSAGGASTSESMTQLKADLATAQARVVELESQVEAMIEQISSARSDDTDTASTSQLKADRYCCPLQNTLCQAPKREAVACTLHVIGSCCFVGINVLKNSSTGTLQKGGASGLDHNKRPFICSDETVCPLANLPRHHC